ncbi:MAG TPA: hypothetical protein VI793_17560 [Anaerolineales bacterium]|nr:hypothetical protein [Anaerolineales bacterium]
MPESNATHPHPSHWLPQALVIGLSVTLVLLLVACLVSAVAIQQRVIPPPSFALRLGRVEIIAPCPRGILCDQSTPFYAIWQGEVQPNGSIQYRELFFVYLKPTRRYR